MESKKIEANELRIGNWCNIHLDYSVQLTGITEKGRLWFVDNPHRDECSWSTSDVKPIPLTEEWLVKLGFSNFNLFDCKIWSGGWNYYVSELKGVYKFVYKKEAKSSWIPLIEVKYVHKLQNLYFALTGEELIQSK